jgi:hypothetical protein
MGKYSAAAKRLASQEATNPPPVMQVVRVDEAGAEQRRHMIEEAAYYLAEQRGFQGGDPLQDWFAAESEVDHRLMGMRPN